jgi:hypothetical protein
MKIALIGLSNSGKSTVFNALTGQDIETTVYPSVSGEPQRGTVKVPDERLRRIADIFRPKKTTHAAIEYIDYIGLTKGDLKQNRNVFDLVKDSDALVYIVRAFHDNTVVHPLGMNDPLRDIGVIELEMTFGDLDLIEKRLERIEESKKHGRKTDEPERKLLLKCRDLLMQERALRDAEFSEEEQKAMSHLQFLSTVPVVVVLNSDEKDLHTDEMKAYISLIHDRYPALTVLALCGKIEMELSRLSPEDRQLFLDDLGLHETAAVRLIQTCYAILGFITFFTYAGDEVKAWTVHKGTIARKAAGKVHSDIERGFIRAEVISFDDLISAGSIQTARDKGTVKIEGKTYEVRDGDIINFRFNV